MAINPKGQCCGRKPLDYKRGANTTLQRPFLFCDRCGRAYDRQTKEQIENWAWRKTDEGFERTAFGQQKARA